MKLKFLIYFFLFLFSAIKTFSDETNQSLNLNDPYFKLGWKNLNDSSNQRIEIPNANASIEVVSSEIYLDEKRDIKNYQEYLYNEETSIENIEDIMIISDKEEYYTIKVRYYDEGYITTDRFKNFTSLNLLETLNKRKDDSVSKFNWILEPSLSENKVSNYGLRVDWVDELITYTYYSVILGKEGFIELRLTLIADGTETEDYFDYYNNLMNEISSTVEFNDQYKYNDYTQGDYISSYTLTNIIDGSWGQGITTDLTNITGYCLVTTGALKKAKIAESDYHRFAGKVITFYIKDSTKEIVDFSEDDSLSVLSGMYGPSDKQKYVKTNKSPNDQNTFDINYSKIDQTGLSFNKWSITLGCQDKEYTEQEMRVAKYDIGNPKSFVELVELYAETDTERVDQLAKDFKERLNKRKVEVQERAYSSYSLFIEQDGTDYLIVYKYPDTRKLEVFAKATYIYNSKGDYAKFFEQVYKNGPSNNLMTSIQPNKFNIDGELEDYISPGYILDDFKFNFSKRLGYYTLNFETKTGGERILSYTKSRESFSLASYLENEAWHASTFIVLSNIEDFKKLSKSYPKTLCNILQEPLIRNLKNKELNNSILEQELNKNGININNLGC